LAVASVVLVGCGLSWIPALAPYRLWDRPAAPVALEEHGLLAPEDQREGQSGVLGETKYRQEFAADEGEQRAPQAGGPLPQAVETPREDVPIETPTIAIVDPERSLDPFYASLTRTADKLPEAVTRILFHGDSLVASDYVTSTVRRALQRQFGDAGHGFVLMADAWPSYFHNDVFRFATSGFQVSRVVGPFAKDGFYGLGGVSFEAGPGVHARFGTVDKGDFGRSVGLFRLLFLKQPHGGTLQVSIDGAPATDVETAAEEFGSGVFEVEVTDGPHQLEVVTAGAKTRTFGVILERKVPGVVLDAIGIQGARIRFLDKQDDAHWAEQLKLRNPNLIVYQFGANESGDGFAYPMTDYHVTMKAVLEQAKRAVPGAGCLVLAAMDRARKQGEELITVPIIPHIVREQEATAREVGCAFWNTYQAMGGRGSMASWVRRGRGQADLTHPNGYGAEILGKWLYGALMQGFNAYSREPHPEAPAIAPKPSSAPALGAVPVHSSALAPSAAESQPSSSASVISSPRR
jgi:lysophospholipase L1-like esterase